MPNENKDLTPNQQKELDTVKWRIDFQQKVMEELRSNPPIQNYFKDFTPDSVKNFIETYALLKSKWHEHGDLWMKVKEDHELKWTEAGWWHLELIQQKKLFDIQCLWRAEKIELKEIELCCDFAYWERNILNCPFVDPITQDEVELYQQYLQSENVQLEDDVEMFLSFQNYHQVKNADSDEDSDYNFPEWYAFYNSHKGTASLMELPDIRGQKESFYIDLARSPEKKKAITELSQLFQHPDKAEATDKDGRKFLNPFDDEIREFFVNAFEDKQTREYYKAMSWAYRDEEETEQLQDDIRFLLSSPEPIPVEEHEDWREAIQAAVRRYSIQLISEHLQEAFAQYEMNMSMHISFPEKDTEPVKAAKKQLIEEILLGRKLNNEPEDLNF